MSKASVQDLAVLAHLHLLLVLADNEVVCAQSLQSLFLLLLTGTEDCHLKAHGLAQLDGHVTQTSQPDDSQLGAGLVQAIVLDRAVGGDASTQQGCCCIQRQVLWQVQQEAATQHMCQIADQDQQTVM